ncbi:hypothetical protein GCM10022238_19370 [Gordonia hankookensis]
MVSTPMAASARIPSSCGKKRRLSPTTSGVLSALLAVVVMLVNQGTDPRRRIGRPRAIGGNRARSAGWGARRGGQYARRYVVSGGNVVAG